MAVGPSARLLKLLLINGGMLGAGLLVLELVFGTWLHGRVKPPEAIPLAGIRYDRTPLNKAWGLSNRIPDRDYTTTFAAPGATGLRSCRILLLGGSTTEERILNARETWSWRLWQDLNAPSHVRSATCPGGYTVVNAGISGHSIVGNYYDISQWLSRQDNSYDLVVLYQGINDWHRGFAKPGLTFWQNDLIHLVFYHSATYKIWRGFDALKTGLFAPSGQFAQIKLEPFRLKQPRLGLFQFKPGERQHLAALVGAREHRAAVVRVINAVLKPSATRLVVITQGMPRCDLRDSERIRYLSDQTKPARLSGVSEPIEQLQRNWSALQPPFYLKTSLGLCLRMKQIRDNIAQVVAGLPPAQAARVRLIDYATTRGVSPQLMTYDDYHADPQTSAILYRDFVRLGLLQAIAKLLP